MRPPLRTAMHPSSRYLAKPGRFATRRPTTSFARRETPSDQDHGRLGGASPRQEGGKIRVR
jgi:hypothetical protein